MQMTNVEDGRSRLQSKTVRFGGANGTIRRGCHRIRKMHSGKPRYGAIDYSTGSLRDERGGNYCEADDAGSKKEFRYRISICKREARETKHWLRMIAAAGAGTESRCPSTVARKRRS